MELVEEETVEIPSSSADHYDEENGCIKYDITDMMSESYFSITDIRHHI